MDARRSQWQHGLWCGFAAALLAWIIVVTNLVGGIDVCLL
jgi:hypothetical protein